MTIKKTIIRILLVLANFVIIYLLYITGIRAIIGFLVGVFVGACVVVYWSMSQNGYFNYIVKDIVKDKKRKKK